MHSAPGFRGVSALLQSSSGAEPLLCESGGAVCALRCDRPRYTVSTRWVEDVPGEGAKGAESIREQGRSQGQ